MKARLLAFCFILAAQSAFAANIAPSEAPSHIGQNVTVEGRVSDVHHAASGKVIFIDMGGLFPNNQFTGVIFSDDAPKFPDVDMLKSKVIEISGIIKLYQGRPEIILSDPAQIKAK